MELIFSTSPFISVARVIIIYIILDVKLLRASTWVCCIKIFIFVIFDGNHDWIVRFYRRLMLLAWEHVLLNHMIILMQLIVAMQRLFRWKCLGAAQLPTNQPTKRNRCLFTLHFNRWRLMQSIAMMELLAPFRIICLKFWYILDNLFFLKKKNSVIFCWRISV